jgi:hypothetical protein
MEFRRRVERKVRRVISWVVTLGGGVVSSEQEEGEDDEASTEVLGWLLSAPSDRMGCCGGISKREGCDSMKYRMVASIRLSGLIHS